MLKKTSQFSGKAKPNTQHLNLSESALAIPLLSLLFVGFLISLKPESCFLEQDNSHGRKISRKIEVFKVRKNERQGFENLRRLIKVERRGSRGDKTYEETAYYISSLTESAQVFAKIIRGHWKIGFFVTWYGSIGWHKSTKSLSGKRFD